MIPSEIYGNENWSLILKEECRLKGCENRVLRRLFGPKRDEGTEEWKILYKEELPALYSLPDIIRVIKFRRLDMDRACCMYGGKERCRQSFIGKT